MRTKYSRVHHLRYLQNIFDTYTTTLNLLKKKQQQQKKQKKTKNKKPKNKKKREKNGEIGLFKHYTPYFFILKNEGTFF